MLHHAFLSVAASALLAAAMPSITLAQWNPANGQWGKSNPTDLRVMTWNIEDSVVSTTSEKQDITGLNSWNALSRIVADLQPDILLVQEAGDRSGNPAASGGGVDSVDVLRQTFRQFFDGGPDQFNGGAQILWYVKLHAPAYDLPFIYVSESTDNFNRNVILSRYPFADVFGACDATWPDFFNLSDAYAPGFNGGIRGFQFAGIDLPNDIYAGDVVVGNSHLKAGGTSGDRAQRLTAAQNIAYLIDYGFNGNGSGVPNPTGDLFSPAVSRLLGPNTPVIWGGDWNEDEDTNGRKGPAEWMSRAQFTGGTDGTDRDRTDASLDNATDPISGSRGTRGSSKLDYLAYQDSIAGVRRSFIFNTNASGFTTQNLPPATAGFSFSGLTASGIASDHEPVIIDFILPLVGAGELSCERVDIAPPFGVLDIDDVLAFLDNFADGCPLVDLDNSGGLNIDDVLGFLDSFARGCP